MTADSTLLFVPLAANETLEQARQRSIQDALREDVGTGDWTALLVPDAPGARARVIVREAAVLCGQAWFDGCLHALDPQAQVRWLHAEGADMAPGDTVCEITARARALLTAERSALNFLQTLSATATLTRQHVRAIQASGAADGAADGAAQDSAPCLVLDTRKTLPGLRLAQKYAVRVGGGHNQRLALWHGILIKENHIAAAGSIAAVMAQARALNAGVDIQIEVETLDQLDEALAAGATSVLLDNFSAPLLCEAVARNRAWSQRQTQDQGGGTEYASAPRALLECSGGVSLAALPGLAATGVDRISIGGLTKDLRAVDFSMRVLG